MDLTRELLLPYQGLDVFDGLCRIRVYEQPGRLPVVIAGGLDDNPGTSLTLAIELVIVFALFLPRRFKIICFCIVTPFEAGIIITANYTFLNYLVLVLGILLVDDKFLEGILPARFRDFVARREAEADDALTRPSSASHERQDVLFA